MSALTAQLARFISLATTHRSDGELVAGFVKHNLEVDFAELIRRHGPMVWGTCRRSLPDLADAEDAFQTVFLVLVQRGNQLCSSQSIGPWLHRVAVWTARNVRRRNARQLAKREMLTEQITAKTGNVDLSLDIDAALLSLPEKVRSSIVLCHILGYSRADAAAQLGCAERTLSSWLSRGLAQLRERLPGLDPTKTLSVAALAVPLGLADTVVQAAISLRTAAVAASVLSPNVSQLVEGVIRMFWVKKATAATVALFTMFAFGIGIGVTTHQMTPAMGGDERTAQSANTSLPALNIDPTIAALELEVRKTTAELEKVKASILSMQGVLANFNESKRYQDTVAVAKSLESRLEELKAKLQSAQELTAVKELEKIKALQQKSDDKQLDALKERLMRLQAETEATQAEHARRMEAQKLAIEELNVLITKLQKEKAQKARDQLLIQPDARSKGYLELHLNSTNGKQENLPSFPFHVNEVGPDGKIVGSVYFTNADVLGRYLARTLKDSSGPKELRIDTRADVPAEQLKLVVEVCKAAGFRDIVVTKTYGPEKLADADEARKMADRERYARQLQMAAEREREAKLQMEVQKQKDLQKLLEAEAAQKAEAYQKALDQKQIELQRLKVLEDVQKALEQKQAELQKLLEQKEEEIRKLKELNKLPKKGEPADPKKP